jgi:hypothetical protein
VEEMLNRLCRDLKNNKKVVEKLGLKKKIRQVVLLVKVSPGSLL